MHDDGRDHLQPLRREAGRLNAGLYMIELVGEMLPEADPHEEVFDLLRDKDVHIDKQTWNRRYRGFMEKIKTGSVYEIAEVLRNLFLLRHPRQG